MCSVRGMDQCFVHLTTGVQAAGSVIVRLLPFLTKVMGDYPVVILVIYFIAALEDRCIVVTLF